MKTPRLKILYYKRLISSDNSMYDTAKDVTDLIDLNNQQGLEIRRDTFSLSIPNYKLRTDPVEYTIIKNYNPLELLNSIHVDDRIEIFAWNPSDEDGLEDTDDAHRVMNGVVTAFTYQLDSTGGKYKLSGANVTEVAMRTVMSTVLFHDQDTLFKTPDAKIKSMIDESNRRNDARDRDHPRYIHAEVGVLKTDGSGELDEASIAAEKYIYPTTDNWNGSSYEPFPETSYVNKYEPMYRHIEKLSATKYTGDEESGEYIFYIDSKNALHWGPKSQNIGTTIKEEDFISWQLQKDAFEIVNTVITHAGVTPGKSGVTALSYNTTSQGEYGVKWKFIPTKIISTMLDNERNNGPGLNAGSIISHTGFPEASAYPWTMQVDYINPVEGGGYEQHAGSEWIVADDDDFEEAARFYGIHFGQLFGNQVVEKLGGPTYRLKATLPEGSLSYTIGNLHRVESKSIGIRETWDSTTKQPTDLKLRIFNIAHIFNKSGWKTTLDLKEDEKQFVQEGV